MPGEGKDAFLAGLGDCDPIIELFPGAQVGHHVFEFLVARVHGSGKVGSPNQRRLDDIVVGVFQVRADRHIGVPGNADEGGFQFERLGGGGEQQRQFNTIAATLLQHLGGQADALHVTGSVADHRADVGQVVIPGLGLPERLEPVPDFALRIPDVPTIAVPHYPRVGILRSGAD